MKGFILHPFLVPLFPIAALYLNNLYIIDPLTLVRPVVVLEIITIVCWAILTRLFHNARTAGVTVSLLMFIFFINIKENFIEILFFWIVAVIGLVYLGRKKPDQLAKFSAPLNVVVITLLLLQSVRYVQSVRDSSFEVEKAPIVVDHKSDREDLPHVVHIILDGFGRPDVIKQNFGADVNFLANYLDNNNFFVADQARANYMQTTQSLASSFSMNYLPGSDKSDTSVAPIPRAQLNHLAEEDSPVKRELIRRGYSLKGSVISSLKLSEWCVYSSHDGLLTMTEDILIQRSCVGPLVKTLNINSKYRVGGETAYRNHYARVRRDFELGSQFVREEQPVYQILHIISPHPPFVFTADGSYRSPGLDNTFIYGDASDFLVDKSTWGDYEKGYKDQVQWVAAEACRLVERILKESKRPVAIIIQGDHGPGLRYNWWKLDDSEFDCRSSILYAIRLPNQLVKMEPEHQSPVNTYRYLFHELWGDDLPLLPKRVFYSTWRNPDEFQDVTSRIEEP